MSELVEGQDYIFDRYAFLGLTPDADGEAIKAAIKERKSQNHPDRHERVSPEARKVAERQWALVEKCEATLTDPEKRAAFDALLAEFREHKPDVISENGNAIWSANYTRISLQDMLGDAPSTAEHDANIASIVGFKPGKLNLLEKIYLADPTDPDAREAYRDELVKAIAHYGISNDSAWEQAGVTIGKKDTGGMRIHLDDFTGRVETRIKEIAEAIPQQVQEHFGLLASGMAAPLMLTQSSEARGSVPSTPVAVNVEDASEIARENFLKRTHRLKENAAKHQEMVGKLLDTLEIWPLSPEGLETETQRICVMRRETPESEPTCVVEFTLNASVNKLDIDMSLRGKTLAELKEVSAGMQANAIEMHDEITDLPVYATYVFEKQQREASPQR